MGKRSYECSKCSYIVAKWLGHCLKCNSWNSFVESNPGLKKNQTKIKKIKVKNLSSLSNIDFNRNSTGINELDRVLGGGIVDGSLTLIGGEPGVGKSTLLLEVVGKIGSKNNEKKILYISGEESEEQVFLRAKRLGVNQKNIYVVNENKWEEIKLYLDKINPILFVLDSIQTTIISQMSSTVGSVSQIKEVTYEILNYCKDKNVSCIVVGHITKDGSISGPKVLEHMVDTVLYFESIGQENQRVLRSIKNRFGNTHEVGLFEMKSNGLEQITNASNWFIEDSSIDSPGRSRTCILEGKRVLFIEVQALVNENKVSNAKRNTQGIDSNRLLMLIAIIEKYFEISLVDQDIFINLVGGLKLNKKEIDLAIVVSILSSYYKKSLEEKILFLGEVGLSGEIRNIKYFNQIKKEIEIYDYKEVVVAKVVQDKPRQKSSLNISALKKVSDLKKYFF